MVPARAAVAGLRTILAQRRAGPVVAQAVRALGVVREVPQPVALAARVLLGRVGYMRFNPDTVGGI